MILQSSHLTKHMITVFIIAAVYFISGKLGLLLAIPPGYATAVFPPSGIALACILLFGYRAWPGVWLGSFLMNISVSLDTASAALILRTVLLAASIGAGASLQAVLSAFLVRRFVGYPTLLTEELDIIKFLILGGPVGCLISATVGVTSLFVAGLIELNNYFFSWWTWWIGDAIGVLIFTPLVLIWTAKPRQVWLRRQVSVSLPLVVTFALVVVLFIYTSSWQQNRVKLEFDRRVEGLAQVLKKNFDLYLEVLHSIEGFYASSSKMGRREFRTFAESFLSRYPGIHALSWNPRIPDTRRAEYEESARHEGYSNFWITELDGQGQIVRASKRYEYVPVFYIEPFDKSRNALGFDVASDFIRFQALSEARDTGKPIATAWVTLVQETENKPAFLVFLPIYLHGLPQNTLEERRHNLQGYVVGVFRINEMVEASLEGTDREGIVIHLHDEATPGWKYLLYSSLSDDQRGGNALAQDRQEQNAELQKKLVFEVAGRKWVLEFFPTQKYLVVNRSWEAWTVLAGGMLFTGLLGTLLLVITGRTARIEELVSKRTWELKQVNEDLEHQIKQREQAEKALIKQAEELTRSNAELEQFAYIASHDLQEPLRMVASFVQLLERRYKDKLDSDANEFIAYAVEGAKRMQALINGLLAYSRIGTHGKPFELTDCEAVLESALSNLRVAIEESNAIVTHDPLPTVMADGSQLIQLFQNLIGNALKFCNIKAPEIHIGVKQRYGEWLFSVKDNGIGIDPQYAERIFVIFQRLHTRSEYSGTGIGLAICKKIVERHGGRIWVESELGKGATFYFTIPDRVM
jgi:signal transduction histidine kinase/integral membrane sensor domain MASE1